MSTDTPQAETPNTRAFTVSSVSLSPWVNEELPPWQELLSTHDVVRLTRRSKWMLAGLTLLGRFPPKRKFRGCALGWLRSDIVDWLAKDLNASAAGGTILRRCLGRRPLQKCLPLNCPACGSQADVRRGRRRRRHHASGTVAS